MVQYNDYIKGIKNALEAEANPEDAIHQKSYMRDKFEFFGIKANSRRKATREFMRKERRPDYNELDNVVKKLWKLPEREYQYFAQELVEKCLQDFDREIIELFEYMVVNKSWWDTVDLIAKKLIGSYFIKFPEEKENYLDKWITSENIWLQRSALLFQLGYKEKTDVDLLFDIIMHLKAIDEFFIQKAIGWSLREYSKVDAKVIREFVKNNDLSSLATREALKSIKNKQ
ncbi:DNA alkylation repair protein [Halanaerobiaceae bacterium Z-7014]|uniref:DNA alkylation repair protein n=1 Tax=Halonatronomonas betaini TaxID=2778430 RepID=A0A931F5Z1_9FIRM|nr:DNA alkylation repair protein [Halonatronomonas betaini]MBF8436360.1 DNA alkylation repair protein [Halonatronomonas betaini]